VPSCRRFTLISHSFVPLREKLLFACGANFDPVHLQPCPTIQAKDISRIARALKSPQSPVAVRTPFFSLTLYSGRLTVGYLHVSENEAAQVESMPPKKASGARKTAKTATKKKKPTNKKRKRESIQGTKYVRNNTLVIGESAEKDVEELELEKTLFGDSDIIERLGGEIPKPSATDSSKSLEDKLHDIEGVGTSAVCFFASEHYHKSCCIRVLRFRIFLRLFSSDGRGFKSTQTQFFSIRNLFLHSFLIMMC
jgi:hypothetical protein